MGQKFSCDAVAAITIYIRGCFMRRQRCVCSTWYLPPPRIFSRQISLQTENNEVSLSVIFHAAKKLGALQAHRGGLAQKFDSGAKTRGPRFRLSRRPIVKTVAALSKKLRAQRENFLGLLLSTPESMQPTSQFFFPLGNGQFHSFPIPRPSKQKLKI